jgi:hypothetical protein
LSDETESTPASPATSFDEEEAPEVHENGPEPPAPAAGPAAAAGPPPSEFDAGSQEDGDAGEGGGQDGGGPSRRRRRRRRRRRGRGALDGAQGQSDAQSATPPADPGGAAPADGRVAEREEPVVPRHIRSEELMPAATGKAGRAKASAGLRPRPRRRRRSGPSIPGAPNGNDPAGSPAGNTHPGLPTDGGSSGGDFES